MNPFEIFLRKGGEGMRENGVRSKYNLDIL
jgi:hypothetical protein